MSAPGVVPLVRWSRSRDDVERVNLSVRWRVDRTDMAHLLCAWAARCAETDIDNGEFPAMSRRRALARIRDALRAQGDGYACWSDGMTQEQADGLLAWATKIAERI